MHILLIGGGGREHALAWSLVASPLVDRLSCAPGNPGIFGLAEAAECDPADLDSVAAYARETGVDLVVPGPGGAAGRRSGGPPGGVGNRRLRPYCRRCAA